MVAFDPQSPRAAGHSHQHNIANWERALSTGAGILLTGLGLHRGGILGLGAISLGSLLLVRGGTGHCNVKGLLHDPQRELRHLRARVRQLSAALSRASAQRGITRHGENDELFDAAQIPGGSYAVDPSSASRMTGRA
jgi:hypothetical protein